MKRRKKLSVAVVMIALVLVMTACSAKSAYDMSTTSSSEKADYGTSGEYDGNGAQYTDTKYEGVREGAGETNTEEAKAPQSSSDSALTGTNSSSTGNTAAQSNEKIIRTFYMDVETQEFDTLITKLNSEINRLGGYVESSEISGRSYSYSYATRYGEIVARIPSAKVDGFVNTVDKNANVVNKQESTENVSLQYIETEGRIETLKIEQERLYALLEKEDTLDDILVLENRLSEIRYELQNYGSQLRYYDNKVAYSTVTLSIQEVAKLTPVSEQKETVGTRIQNGLSETLYNLSEGFQNFFVWFVVNLPYLLIWGVIIAVIVIIARSRIKKYKAKRSTAPAPIIVNNGQSGSDTPDGQ
ncbi:MAG TPA: DUF4349 domain-containing protein [Clostridiales bacterium]|nr:DUF4349 domain-containing protein [Clostridiales bacterium]